MVLLMEDIDVCFIKSRAVYFNMFVLLKVKKLIIACLTPSTI